MEAEGGFGMEYRSFLRLVILRILLFWVELGLTVDSFLVFLCRPSMLFYSLSKILLSSNLMDYRVWLSSLHFITLYCTALVCIVFVWRLFPGKRKGKRRGEARPRSHPLFLSLCLHLR